MNRRLSFSTILTVLGIILLVATTVFPVYWLLNISLLSDKEVFRHSPHYFPPFKLITLQAYREIFVQHRVGTYIINSIGICLGATFLTLSFSIAMAYYLAKFQFRFKRFFFYFIIWSLTLPWVVYVLPLFRIANSLGLLDTHLLLILLYGISGIPLFCWFALPYLEAFPNEIIDAARIDGAGEFVIVWKIVGPALWNVVIALFLLRFIWAYNDLLYSLIFAFQRAKMIMPALNEFPTPFHVPFPKMGGGAVVSMVPIIIIVVVFQRYIVNGLTGRTIK